MFILNNTAGRKYSKLYCEAMGEPPVIFDITRPQRERSLNTDWSSIKPQDLVCVIFGSKNLSTIYQVAALESVMDEAGEELMLLRGNIVAKAAGNLAYTRVLNRSKVEHSKLKNNKFAAGLAAANLGEQLDGLKIKSLYEAGTVGELKAVLSVQGTSEPVYDIFA